MILFFLLCVWAVALIAICAVCAAGGRADEERDSWYTDFQRQKDANRRERDAA